MINRIIKMSSVILFVILLLTLNITKVVSFSESFKFNMALSDVLIPFFLISSLFLWKKYGFKHVFRYVLYWIILLLWIIGVGFFAIQNDVIKDAGWMGIFKELVKTGLCIIYFFVGYNTLRLLRIRTFKLTWSLSILIFLIGGFIIYILATKGIYFWSDDPKYLSMFMGTDTDPNHAATFLSLSFFAMGIFAIYSKSNFQQSYYYLIMALSALGLVFTGSRGGMLGFILGMVVLLVFYAFKNWRIALALFLVLIMMSMVFLIVDQYYLDSIFTKRLLYKLIDVESGFDIRANLSSVAWKMGIDHPIFGVGRGNYVLNSKPFFEKLGVDFIDNIPHNTYFGLFAETGILGLMLFCMPFYLIIYTGLKRYKKNIHLLNHESTLIIWICSAMVTLGIQAFVLNVENRRFLWYLAGLLIYIFESNPLFIEEQSQKISERVLNYALIILVTCVLSVSFFTIFEVHVPNLSETVDQNYRYEIPFDGFVMNETYEVGINLIIAVNESLTKRVELRIVEIGTDGKTHVIDSFYYFGASGTVVRKFTPTMLNSKVVIKAHKLDQSLSTFVIQPIFLRDNDQIYDLTQWYFMQTEKLLKKSIQKNMLTYDEWVQKTDLIVGLDATFNKEVRVKSVTVHQDDEISTKVSVKLEALNTIQDVVYPFMYGFPNDSHILPENLVASNAENYVLIDPVDDSVWQSGEIRTFTFSIPRQIGIYLLRLGAYRLVDDQMDFLKVDDEIDSKPIFLDLGWLNLDMFTGKLVFE